MKIQTTIILGAQFARATQNGVCSLQQVHTHWLKKLDKLERVMIITLAAAMTTAWIDLHLAMAGRKTHAY
jgi:hypothetical protein